MGTNGTTIAAEPKFGEEEFRSQTRKRVPEHHLPDSAYSSAVSIDPADAPNDDFVLAPLVDKIAFGIARGLVVAVKELEQHIATETRKVGDAVERQIDTLQVSLQELFRFVAEQRSANVAVQEQLQQMDARHAADLAAFQSEARSSWKSVSERVDGVCGDVGVHQEDIAAVKVALGTVCSRIDSLVERLDRQAEAVRLMHTNYSQRETELEQLVNGLARLRAFPTPLPTNGL